MKLNHYLLGLIISLFLIGFSSISTAGTSMDRLSEGCKSCVRGYDCSRTNKTCNATCRANLYSKEIDLESCRASCIGKLEKCLLSANKSCQFYCGDE
ncbi:hypothetical protein MNBD_GAMMA08-3024 [hydrothermal vent metagenome]|uniref:Uncharacterized protein n=1 Tax=hydrothermal vent metagenome TaxID=652676 RepID=A0A3B0YDZ0_9ZZZZ